jgi:hypothetical protein
MFLDSRVSARPSPEEQPVISHVSGRDGLVDMGLDVEYNLPLTVNHDFVLKMDVNTPFKGKFGTNPPFFLTGLRV